MKICENPNCEKCITIDKMAGGITWVDKDGHHRNDWEGYAEFQKLLKDKEVVKT